MVQHIPAWKRLGLKLKYAKDTAEDALPIVKPIALESLVTSTASPKPEQGTKRSRTEETHELDGSSMKRQKSQSKSNEPSANGLGIRLDGKSTDTTRSDDTTIGAQSPPQKTPRKKSVTFTPETKVEDGFSAGDYFKVWTGESQEPHTPPRSSTEIIPVTPPSATAEVATQESEASPKEKPKPKAKKPKQKEKRKDKPAAAPATAYLDYLTQFHTDKPAWKFNKAKQNDVLRNVWNIYRIPASYNEALLAYIHGLQGVNARQRLGEAAQEILESEPQATSGETSDEQAEEQRQQAEKRIRAELVVKQLQSWSIPPPLAVKTQPAANGEAKHMKFNEELPTPVPVKKNRKSRTEVASSDSSSSESSSESSDSSTDSESEESSSSSGSEDSDS